MKLKENFTTSGHHFSEDEGLQRFRFSLLNSLLLIASIFTFINYFASIFEITAPFPTVYEYTLLFYALSSLVLIYVLRQKKSNYLISVHTAILCSLVVFYCALLVVVGDEFRLIWFFLAVFAGFVLIGKRYGLMLMLLVLISIMAINQIHDLGFSDLAEFSFLNSFLIFTAFGYFFLEKIEKDAREFTQLNAILHQKIDQEKAHREEQEKMLLQQYRMANIGGMIDAIAHQWRQPLMHINAILLNMDYAIHKDDNNYLEKKVDEVASLTTHMSQTIDDFRGLFDSQREKQSFCIKTEIENVLLLMKNSFKGVRVELIADIDLAITSYKGELAQLLIILLSNAIEVLKSREVEPKNIMININEQQENLVITVEDNAGGIKPANLRAIFDPYFTTKKQSGGTGLGLYIAKIIAEQRLVGKLTAVNTSHGAKFTLTMRKENALSAE